jgi:hypothetical protein
VTDWLRGEWDRRPYTFTDCRENLPPVSERNTNFPEVLICEMTENGNVDLVLGKSPVDPCSAGRLRVGKDFLHERSIGRRSHVFGLLMRFT